MFCSEYRQINAWQKKYTIKQKRNANELNVYIQVMLDRERERDTHKMKQQKREEKENKKLYTHYQQCACSLFLWRSLTKVIHQIFRSFFWVLAHGIQPLLSAKMPFGVCAYCTHT